mgnify:CR=1 FL=1
MKKTLSICITVDGGNDKRVHYSSIELPAKDYEIEDSLQEARVNCDDNFSIGKDIRLEIESTPLLPSLVDKQITARTFGELNFLAKRLATLDEDEKLALRAVVNKKISDGKWKQSVDIKDLINLTYGLDNVSVIHLARNDEDLGQLVIENDMHPDVAAIPFESRYLLNKSDIGRLQRESEGGVFVDNIYVIVDDYEETEVYDGITLPESEEKNEYVFRLKIAKAPVENPEETENTAEWIKLPIDKEQANAIAREHGVGRIEDCVYFDFESAIPQISSEIFGNMQDFDAFNAIAERYSKLGQFERAKYKAILTAAGAFRTADAVDVIKNINAYEFAPEYEYPEDYLKGYLKMYLNPRFDSEWLDTLVSRYEGVELQKRLGATCTQYGFISAKGCSLYALCKRNDQCYLDEELDAVEVCGVKGVFANERIAPQDVPKGLYKYDLRYSDERREFTSIEKKVIIDHGGTVLLKEQLDLGPDGVIEFDEETSPNFLGYEETPRELLAENEQEETDGIGGIKQ